ncbi:MAG: nuclear transport factor 2 family protein [Bdellovibrionota bacterium]
MVQTQIVRDFIKGLQSAEENGDPTSLAKLFAPEAELLNLTRPTARASESNRKKACKATAFFSQYLSAFDYVSSHFTNVIEDQDSAVLEWHSTGRLHMGKQVDYSGVSVLEHDGEKIKSFRTYYDSAALLPNISLSAKSVSETAGIPAITNEATS